MNYFAVTAKEDSLGCTADVPAAMTWVGAYDIATNTYFIATPAPPTPANCTRVTDLATECAKRGLQVNEVLRWRC